MMRCKKLEHRFVRHLPEMLEPGILYISMGYATAAHSCCCGCGEEVVTPFSPAGWRMTFNGETVSLWPSVGNWSLRCRSHYMIDHGHVLEAGLWSDEQVAAQRRRDKAARDRYFGTPAVTGSVTTSSDRTARHGQKRPDGGHGSGDRCLLARGVAPRGS